MATSKHRSAQLGTFIKTFNGIARHRHRYAVFQDFVTMSAITLHNAIHKNETLEAEYLQIVARYNREEVDGMCRLLAILIDLLDPEPRDVLGPLYMDLELGNTNTGQFFTPPELSKAIAMMVYGEQVEKLKKPFITLSEPACGAGGMVLAFVDIMISRKLNPAERLWVQCQDIDRTAALMCYIQLALWNVPGVVIVGNTIANEAREVFYTPAHCIGFWGYKLRRYWNEEQGDESPAPISIDVDLPGPIEDVDPDTLPGLAVNPFAAPAGADPIRTSRDAPSAHEVAFGQLGFDFSL